MEAIDGSLTAEMPRSNHDFARGIAATPSGLAWFRHLFDSSIAETIEERQACLRTRFQVYCLDKRFERVDDNPGGFEVDPFDRQSLHALLRHRASGNAIGTVRLVLPRADGERRPLPIELLLAGTQLPFPVERTAEVSRLALLKSFRQCKPTQGLEAALPPQVWRDLHLHLPVGLVRSCIEMSVREGISHWTAVMTPSLMRLLARFGIHMNPLGGLVEHHGLRQPCWAEIDTLLQRMLQERPDVWKLVTHNGRLWPRQGKRSTH